MLQRGLLHRGLLQTARLASSLPNTSEDGVGRKKVLPNEVWPTMITPFLSDSSQSVDWRALDSEQS